MSFEFALPFNGDEVPIITGSQAPKGRYKVKFANDTLMDGRSDYGATSSVLAYFDIIGPAVHVGQSVSTFIELPDSEDDTQEKRDKANRIAMGKFLNLLLQLGVPHEKVTALKKGGKLGTKNLEGKEGYVDWTPGNRGDNGLPKSKSILRWISKDAFEEAPGEDKAAVAQGAAGSGATKADTDGVKKEETTRAGARRRGAPEKKEEKVEETPVPPVDDDFAEV